MPAQKYTREDAQLWADYRDLDGMTYPEIEEMLGLPDDTCARVIRKYGLTVRPNNRDYDEDFIVELYLCNTRIADIVKMAGVGSTRTVYMVLKKHGIESGSRPQKEKGKREKDWMVIQMYKAGKSYKYIKENADVSISTIGEILIRNDIPRNRHK